MNSAMIPAIILSRKIIHMIWTTCAACMRLCASGRKHIHTSKRRNKQTANGETPKVACLAIVPGPYRSRKPGIPEVHFKVQKMQFCPPPPRRRCPPCQLNGPKSAVLEHLNPGGHFGPEKKYFPTDIPPEPFPLPCLLLETPHPPSIFDQKPDPRATSSDASSLSPAPEQKKIKNIRNVHQEIHFSGAFGPFN